MSTRYLTTNGDFVCQHCSRFVSANLFFSGVNNRNHCPYCLHSRHLDLFKAGDRLSACKASMAPVGLTMKRTRKKYASRHGGELMLVHRCSECSAISINRIAADDDAQRLLEVFQCSPGRDEPLRERIIRQEIDLLEPGDAERVFQQLFGLSQVQDCLEGAGSLVKR